MTYSQTVDYLFSHLPLFQRTGPPAYKPNLNNTHALDGHFNHPHTHFKTVHVAGTNGKGSVSHMLAAVLQMAGYKTGLFTSPHLVDFRERIRINGEMISEDYVCRFVDENMNLIEKISPSFFELTTLMAFKYFADSQVDIAVIETGMGGRLDSTNIISPLVSVITNIGLDHTQFLGNTIAVIAEEKAGIIKKNTPIVIGEFQPETIDVYKSFATKMESEFSVASDEYTVSTALMSPGRRQVMNIRNHETLVYKELEVDLLGIYQKKNVPTVLQTIDFLKEAGIKMSRDAIYEGLKNVAPLTGLRGRWETLGFNPLIICDTGHNAEGIAEVAEQIRHTPYKKLHFIFGTVNDKDATKVLSLLPKDAEYYFTKADIPRALDPYLLKEQAEKSGLKGEAFPEITKAFEAASSAANREDLIFIGGSTFVVGEFIQNYPQGFLDKG
jgi:dihydrofolate synthase/folylpolyglutamate synthase